MLSKVLELLKKICTVDLRALALMRITISLTLIVDLIVRLINLRAHYTDQGILPLEALFRYAWNQYHFSFYTMGSIWQWQLLIFAINFLFILFLLFGYHTRISTILCWLFLISIHNRNPLIHQGGDDLLRLILFWAIFLPWGYYYSVDATLIHQGKRPIKYTGLAVLGYILQVMYIYLFSALLKNSSEWNSEFSALYYALSFDQIVLPFGKWIYPHYTILKAMTAMVYYTELLAPFLLVLPIFTSAFRLTFIAIMLALHIGISFSLNVGIFPLIAVAAMIALLPGIFLDKFKSFNIVQNISHAFDISRFFNARKAFYIPAENFFVTNLMIFFICYTLSWNISSLGKSPLLSTGKMEWIGHFFRVDQHWGMFAPAVFKDDGWFIFEGELENEKKIDPLNGDTIFSLDRPSGIQSLFKSDRWRKYSENFLFVVNGHYRPYFCFYLLNLWNEKHNSDKMRALKIYYIKEVSLPNYQIKKGAKEVLCTCELFPPKNIKK